jgi:predicted nucleic acid-binding protein
VPTARGRSAEDVNGGPPASVRSHDRLVDTSVWIRFLSNHASFAAELEDLLGREEVCGRDFVCGELLFGDKGGRTKLLADHAPMHHAPMIDHADLVAFVRERRLHGRGIGWIDAHLLASVLVGRVRLWTTDPRLETVAKELAVSYG